MAQPPEQSMPGHAIAVVGMAGRFPGADDVASLWANVLAGKEGITFFDDDQLDPAIPPELREDPGYVKAKGLMADCDRFDAAFFGVAPLEARLMDPQHRVLLELVWSALESSGHRTSDCDSRIGVYVGANWNRYRARNVASNPEVIQSFGELNTALANEQDFLATRISYKLNLRGPSYSVNTACSTSLVAIAQAAGALANSDCDMAIAGGVSVSVPVRAGYISEAGGMLSQDGHCRPFDEQCTGTTFNDGAGVVVLRRLADAIADGDHIHAVIRGHAVNNDGALKVSFGAPSVAGQAEVLSQALRHAEVDPQTVSYIEAHGTGTPLGDPIEFAALARAYQSEASVNGDCAIGSVKSSVGHLVHAAGVTGFIMAVMAVERGVIPPTLFFQSPNPRLQMDRTRFYVPSAARAWPKAQHPRRAGVSSFGVGGTNAHVVIEQAPAVVSHARLDAGEAATPGLDLLCLSAKTEEALGRQIDALAQFLATRPPELSLGSVIWTLQQGREPMMHRLAVSVGSLDECADVLREREGMVIGSARNRRSVTFQFPGFGAQRAGMGRRLYAQSPVFRRCLDEGMRCLGGMGGEDLRGGLLGEGATAEAAFGDLQVAQPALFLFEYALAVTLESSGVVADTLIGCSLGEFAAAVLAGVVTLEDALRVVMVSAEACSRAPQGSMITAFCTESEARDIVSADVSIAAVHVAEVVVVAGAPAAIEAAKLQFEQRGVRTMDLPADRAYHSPSMEPASAEIEQLLTGITLSAPQRRMMSSVTGRELTAEEAVSPAYWARILSRPLRFADALTNAGVGAGNILVEVGPGSDLTGLALLQPEVRDALPVAAAPGCAQGRDAVREVLAVVAHCWMHGVEVDLGATWSGPPAQRVALPTYSFERQLHWLDPARPVEAAAGPADAKASGEAGLAGPDQAAIGGVRSAAGLRAVRDLVERQIALMQSHLRAITLAEEDRGQREDAPDDGSA